MQEHDFIVGEPSPPSGGTRADGGPADNDGGSSGDGGAPGGDPHSTRHAWQRVTEHLADLGSTLREHYVRTGQTEAIGELRSAFEDLTRAAGQIGNATSQALNDPDVQDHLKATMSAVVAAVAHTVSDVANEAAAPDA